MNVPHNILAVDDNPNNLEVLHEILDDRFQVYDALDAWQALELAERLLPRIVLLDVMLPDLDGYETCRRMRRILGMQTARIIMVSAKAMPSERDAGYAAGADDYLAKPFDDDELLTAINGYEPNEDSIPERFNSIRNRFAE